MSTPSFAAPGETRCLTIHVSDRVFAGLVTQARGAGYTPALYAKLLFEAGYAARCGKGEGDPLLKACVAKSLDRRPAAASAPAPRPGEPRGVHEAVAVPVPGLVPVPIAVPFPVAPAVPLAVHISGSQPLTPEVVEPLATLIGAAVEKLRALPEQLSPPPSDEAAPQIDPAALVRRVRALKAAGNSVKEIAAELGVDPMLVRAVLAGRVK